MGALVLTGSHVVHVLPVVHVALVLESAATQ